MLQFKGRHTNRKNRQYLNNPNINRKALRQISTNILRNIRRVNRLTPNNQQILQIGTGLTRRDLIMSMTKNIAHRKRTMRTLLKKVNNLRRVLNGLRRTKIRNIRSKFINRIMRRAKNDRITRTSITIRNSRIQRAVLSRANTRVNLNINKIISISLSNQILFLGINSRKLRLINNLKLRLRRVRHSNTYNTKTTTYRTRTSNSHTRRNNNTRNRALRSEHYV